MGLDIYLSGNDDHLKMAEHEAAWEAWYEKWKDVPDDDLGKRASREEIPPYPGHRDVPSRRYPEHLFNRRYLRSSYNTSGFNRSVPDLTGTDHDLYWVFDPLGDRIDSGDDVRLTAADAALLEQCRDRALTVTEELRTSDRLRVESFTSMIGEGVDHMWPAPPTTGEVLAWYRQERDRDRKVPPGYGEGYGCAKGTVFGFTEGAEVLAVTVGRDVRASPAAILVFRVDEETLTSYVQSAEITAEFCDEAIDLIAADGSCYLMWSA